MYSAYVYYLTLAFASPWFLRKQSFAEFFVGKQTSNETKFQEFREQ